MVSWKTCDEARSDEGRVELVSRTVSPPRGIYKYLYVNEFYDNLKNGKILFGFSLELYFDGGSLKFDVVSDEI